MVQEFVTLEEIALSEHEVLRESCILEGDASNMVWYIAGVHDMAEWLMEKLRQKDKERRGEA